MSVTRIRVSPAPAPPAAYDVVIAPGALRNFAGLLASAAPAARYALITDDVVRELHGDRLLSHLLESGLTVDAYSFPAGEPYKTRDVWSYLSDAMNAAGMGRDACVIAFGGGVVCDVGGFVAATFLRGIPCVQVPTTLLSMLDASIGGKTGVDTDHGKNLIGAFHQPKLVVMDPSVVWTQEHADLVAGAAEAVKHGCIVDGEYFDWILRNASAFLRSDTETLARLITRSVEIKSAVVGRDPLEHGERAILNFGHTIAHALERETQYRMSHGHAVSIGIVVEALIGEAMGVTVKGTARRIAHSLQALGLPFAVPDDIDRRSLIEHTRNDKKARRGRTRYVLLERIGAVARDSSHAWTWDVADSIVLGALDERAAGL
jgi:3-dehydroquinate synthase